MQYIDRQGRPTIYRESAYPAYPVAVFIIG